MDTRDGYFSPDGTARRVSRELALMLGGGRALLLQVAHPLVAAGVAEHSGYRENPWKRLEGTMNAVWAIVFGTRAQADRATQDVCAPVRHAGRRDPRYPRRLPPLHGRDAGRPGPVHHANRTRHCLSVMRPPLPLPLRPAMQWSNVVTAGLMPADLRSDYGLAWDPARAALVAGSREWTRHIAMRLLPDRLRTVPAAR